MVDNCTCGTIPFPLNSDFPDFPFCAFLISQIDHSLILQGLAIGLAISFMGCLLRNTFKGGGGVAFAFLQHKG